MSTPATFEQLISSIEATNRQFARRAKVAVNTSLTLRNWLIGYSIEEYQLHGADRADYGSDLGGVQDRMAIRSTRGLANKLPQTNLREFVATMPPLPGQRRIAESVSQATRRLDDLAEANRTTIKLLKERREVIIAAAVTEQLEISRNKTGVAHAC